MFFGFELAENMQAGSDNSSTISSEVDVSGSCVVNLELAQSSLVGQEGKPEAAVLDLYSGCGGMSTGLCLGAKLSKLNLVTVSFILHDICLV